VHVYVFDNNEQDYVGDIIVREGDTIEEVERRILTVLLGPIIGYTVPFEMTEVRITGRRSPDEVDFRGSNRLFTEAIREENEQTARVLEYDNFDLFIEMRDRNNDNVEPNHIANEILNYNRSRNTTTPAAGGSTQKRRGGKRTRKTARKTARKSLRRTSSKRKSSKTRRHRK